MFPHLRRGNIRRRCAALGSSYLGLPGHLVTITSPAEEAFVHTLPGIRSEAWAGGFQNPITEPDPKAGWTWVNGEGTFPGDNLGPAYANWNGGEPNDAYGPASEQYLGIDWLGANWNDERALGNISGYVVEYQGVPEAGSLFGLSGLVWLGVLAGRRALTGSERP